MGGGNQVAGGRCGEEVWILLTVGGWEAAFRQGQLPLQQDCREGWGGRGRRPRVARTKSGGLGAEPGEGAVAVVVEGRGVAGGGGEGLEGVPAGGVGRGEPGGFGRRGSIGAQWGPGGFEGADLVLGHVEVGVGGVEEDAVVVAEGDGAGGFGKVEDVGGVDDAGDGGDDDLEVVVDLDVVLDGLVAEDLVEDDAVGAAGIEALEEGGGGVGDGVEDADHFVAQFRRADPALDETDDGVRVVAGVVVDGYAEEEGPDAPAVLVVRTGEGGGDPLDGAPGERVVRAVEPAGDLGGLDAHRLGEFLLGGVVIVEPEADVARDGAVGGGRDRVVAGVLEKVLFLSPAQIAAEEFTHV